ncbi:hypothetical protein F5144DRAFT_579284 [Chaetomium tenue]|uniref:Uncharacterized protein n=1 Tax=Chaetomium tenue TaxID=1854479 RepID=A0ACB7P5M4_9PEZI|nr:hypothetical protein F5144DRAFT_579284 [Chaetomium globosum]
MPSNKDRLYVALYARGGAAKMPDDEDKYHWALLVGPKNELSSSRGKRYHAKEKPSGTPGQLVWEFEGRDTLMEASAMALVRVLVAKITNMDRLVSALQSVPVRGSEPQWNRVEWVKEALEILQRDGKAVGTSVLGWHAVRDAAMQFVEKKAAEHRFDGRAEPGQFDISKVATYDLLEGEETIP